LIEGLSYLEEVEAHRQQAYLVVLGEKEGFAQWNLTGLSKGKASEAREKSLPYLYLSPNIQPAADCL
jgi:hypothetical protein